MGEENTSLKPSALLLLNIMVPSATFWHVGTFYKREALYHIVGV